MTFEPEPLDHVEAIYMIERISIGRLFSRPMAGSMEWTSESSRDDA